MRFVLFCFLATLVFLPSHAREAPKGRAEGGKSDPLKSARQRLLRGNYVEARAAYEDLAKDLATRAQAAIGLASVDRAEGEYDKAAATLDDALKALPDQRDLLAHRADLHFFRGQWDEAKKDAEAVLAKDDRHFLARWVRARLLRDTGDTEKASEEMRWFVRAYTQASNDDKDITDPDLLAIVGQAGTEHARWNNLSKQFSFILEEVYGDILKRDRDFWIAEDLAGRMLLEKYNKAEAEDAFDNALKVNPKAVEALVGKGLLCLQTYDLKEAEILAERALAVNPRHPEALRLRAELDLIAGDISDATRRLVAARAVNPRDEVVLGKLAACFLLAKKPEAVADVVKLVESFDSKPAAFYHALGETLDDRKLWLQSEEYLKKAAELRPMLPASRAALAMLYLRLGREADARGHLDAAYKADPFNVRVFNSRKVLNHLDKYATIETPHYTVRYDAGADRVLAEFIADYLEQNHAELKRQFQFEPTGKTLFELFSNHEMFSGRTVALPDLHTIGACTGKVVTMASPHSKELNRLFNWGRVIRHELVHVFNLAQSDFQVPHWLTEGLAVRNEGGATSPQWTNTLRERLASNTLLNLDNIMLSFVRPKNHEEWSLAYYQSQLYVNYMTKTLGEESVGKLLEAFKTGADTGDLLKRVLKVDKAEFEAGYRKYVEEVVKAASGTKPPRSEKAMTLAQLEAARKKNPDDLTINARLAEKLLQSGKNREAKTLADEVLEKEATHPLAATVKARLLVRDKDEAGARKLLEEALAASPEDHRLLLALGKVYVAAKEWEPAAKVLELGRKLAPLEGNWLEQLSQIYGETKQMPELLSVLADLAGQDPDILPVRLKLAKIHHEMKRFAEAEHWSRDVLFIDVKHEEARQILLESLREQKKDAEAAKIAKWYE